jgi:secreted trypsin-like serine protease
VFDDCVAVGNDERFGCTGTLIAPRVVLTAGHCATLATRIFVGNDVDRRGKIYEVAKAMRHPRYGRPAHANDLLVLLLKRPVEGVVPRAIASSALIDSARIGRAVGFGNTEETGSIGYGIKRQVDIPIASNACAGRVDGDSDARVYGCIARHEIVAGKSMLARDSCTGDSGGPFYVADSRGAWRLAGATSRATDTAGSLCGDGGIYVRIDAYLDWIQKAAQIRLRPAEAPRRPARRPKPRKPPRKPRRPKAKSAGRRGPASRSRSPQGKRGRGR